MKLFILIFNLLSITSVLSKGDRLNKRDLCAFQLQSYGKCYLYSSPENEEELTMTCQTLNDEKCKILFEKGVSIIDECKGENGPKNELKVKSAYLQKKALCAKDENGNSCPYKDFIIKTNIKNPTADILNKSLESLRTETCKSEICTIVTVDAIDGIVEKVDKQFNGFNLTSEEQNVLKKEEIEFFETMKTFVNGLKETSEKLKNECSPKNASNAGNATNPGNTTNPGNATNSDPTTSGIENLKYFSIQYTFSALVLVLTWWMYILY